MVLLLCQVSSALARGFLTFHSLGSRLSISSSSGSESSETLPDLSSRERAWTSAWCFSSSLNVRLCRFRRAWARKCGPTGSSASSRAAAEVSLHDLTRVHYVTVGLGHESQPQRERKALPPRRRVLSATRLSPWRLEARSHKGPQKLKFFVSEIFEVFGISKITRKFGKPFGFNLDLSICPRANSRWTLRIKL